MMKARAEVITGDCLVEMPRLIERGLIFDACITDPPYGTTACAWDSVIPFSPMWAALKRVVKKNGAIVLFGSQPFTSALVMSNPRAFKYQWVWEKAQAVGHLNAYKMPMNKHEDVCVFGEGGVLYNPQITPKQPEHIRPVTPRTRLSDCYGAHGLESARLIPADCSVPSSVIKFANEQGTIHPTQKPVELMRYLVRTYSNEGDTVLDFTCGSGSTGVACMIENRNFIGIEKDESYAEIARARIKRAQGIACDIPKRERLHKPTPLFDEQVA